MVPSSYDAAMLDSLNSLIHSASDHTARRAYAREPFHCVQLLAPYDGEVLPDQRAFRQVRCEDLSRGGFCFLTVQEPNYDRVIVALGQIPFQFYVAEIVNVRPEPGDRPLWRCGARFVGRIRPAGSAESA